MRARTSTGSSISAVAALTLAASALSPAHASTPAVPSHAPPAQAAALPPADQGDEAEPASPARGLADGLPVDPAEFGAKTPDVPDGDSSRPRGVSDEVRDSIEADGEASVIVRLSEQPDMNALADRADAAGEQAATALRTHDQRARAEAANDARAASVVDDLRGLADRTQGDVRDLLDSLDGATKVSSFWIFNGFSATVDADALDALVGHPGVAGVTLDETIALPEPDEAGDPNLPSWSLEKVNAPDVWGDYGVRGDGVVVGIMDSGVDGSHPALSESWRGTDGGVDSSWFVPTGEDYPTPGDGFGHGTHVMGSIVGDAPGELTGVAPGAEWIAAKIFRDSGSTTDSIIHAGFEWMLQPGGDPAKAPDVVNNSWGSKDGTRTEFWDDIEAWTAAGIVPVFSNGNEGPAPGTVGSPGSYPHVIGVGATDDNDFIADFSSRGPISWDGQTHIKPDLSAPGKQIRSAWPLDLRDDGYRTISGTSMAAPHVTGAVALMLAAAPDLTFDDVRNVLTDTARVEQHMGPIATSGPNNTYGAGIADAFAAVTNVAHSGTLSGTITGPDGPVEATVTIGDHETTSSADDGTYELTVPEGSHEATVTAYGFATATESVTITTGDATTLDLPLETAPDHTLTGTVTSGDGAVPGARVSVPGTPVDPVFTNEDGGFDLVVAAGIHEVRVDATGHEPSLTDVEIDGDTTFNAELTALTTPSAPGWRQFQNNPTHSGLSGDALAAETLQRSWTADAGSDVVFAAPVMDDRRVYVGSDGGALTAFDIASGEQAWQVETGDALRGAPAVADGLVYTGGGLTGGIRALDAETGETQWSVDTPGRITVYSAPVVADGVVYVATGPSSDRDDTVLALDAATGDQLWATDVGTSVFTPLAVAEGMVVVGTADSAELISLDAATGEELWTMARTGDYFIGGASLVDGTVYVATTGESGAGSLLAIDASTGTLRWENDTHGDGQGSAPAVYGDLVIAGSHGKAFVAAYDRESGESAWHYGVDGAISVSAMVSSDGYVVAASQLDKRVFAIDAATGRLVWDEDIDNGTSASAYANGVLVTADTQGEVHAFRPTGTLTGTITGPDGPVAATVTLAETSTAVPVNDDGTFELAHPPGEYTLSVAHYGLKQVRVPVEIVAGRTQHLDVELTAAEPGAVIGTVTDSTGTPLAGVTINLDGTPLDPETTDEAGGFEFAEVIEGDYELSAELAGYVPITQAVTVAAGETTTVELQLVPYDIAVVGDYENRITGVLADLGYTVESATYEDVTSRPDQFEVVVANGADDTDPGEQAFLDFIEATDNAGTSVVWLDQWSHGWGAIDLLNDYLGDPAEIVDGYDHEGDVSLIPTAEHPLTDGLPLGEKSQILVPNDWSAFTGYSGVSVADLHTGEGGVKGSGVAYQPRGTSSTHVLLGSLAAAASWGDPAAKWTPAATTVIDNAVRYASDAAYGEITGTVTTADGTPVSAIVQVVDGPAETTADASGDYQLFLDPGEYTLRFSLLGYTPVEQQVTVAEDESQAVDVELADAGTGTLTGVVTSGGDPVAGAGLTVAGSSATTSADGSYEITDVPGGDHTLKVGATSYFSTEVPVTVADGQETVADIVLDDAPHVGVLEDYDRDGIVALLQAAEFTAEEIDWTDVDRVGEFDVIVLNDPDDPGEAAFLGFVDALDQAGVSGIFPDDRFSSYGGARLLREYLGDPEGKTDISDEGTVSYQAVDDGHALFDGLPATTDILFDDRDATTIDGYSGIPIANVVTDGDTSGVGAAYSPRTGDSVHLLLSGLAATLFQHPDEDWTDDGKALYVNAVKWAADPGMGSVAGTVTAAEGGPLAATVEVDGLGLSATADANGEYILALPPGEHTLRYSYFGYETAEAVVTVGSGETAQHDQALATATDVSLSGAVTGDGAALAGADVELLGTPLRSTTGSDGTYTLDVVTPGTYELEVIAEGFVRTRVSVTIGEPGSGDVTADIAVRPSPTVGIVEDYQDRLAGYLSYWGYQPRELDWSQPVDLTGVDLVIANVGSSADPGKEGFAAFQDNVTRAGLPVIWLDQYGRGSFQYLEKYEGDPAVIGDGQNDGTVTATMTDPSHPLAQGQPESFELVAEDEPYSWFDEFSGTTLATVDAADEAGGGLAGVRGRGASGVDVLLGTLSVSYAGYPAYGEQSAKNWTPEAERLLRNALGYALDADPPAGEVRGTVTNASGEPVAAEIRVAESGRTYTSAADGTFVVPLPPGTWTLETSAFGYAGGSDAVSVEAGEVTAHDIVLTPTGTGTVSGVVTGSDTPVEGAEVSIVGTPLSGVTAADGGYQIAGIPKGDWTLRVFADGYQAAEFPVTIAAGATVTVDAALEQSRTVAVVADYSDSITDLLSDEGYAVTQYSRSAMGDLATEIESYDLTIFNGTISSSYRDDFELAIDAAESAGVSTLYGGQWGGYAIGALSDVRGDPAEVDYSFVPDGIDYVPSAEHPIFDGYAVGTAIPLITDEGSNQQWLSFSEYSGATMASVAARDNGTDLGTAAGYRLTSASSVEVLLGSLSASGYGSPGDEWTDDAERIYLNAVGWATTFAAAAVTGTITSDGTPVSNATVTAVEADTSATTDESGAYTLDLLGGDYTIEVSAHGYEPASQQVTVSPGENVTVDVDLTPLPRGGVAGVVTSADDGSPIADATVTGDGPDEWEAVTDETGAFDVDDVLSGSYEVEVTADGFLTETLTIDIDPDGTASLDLALRPINVAVVGDVDGAMAALLRSQDVAAGTVTWDGLDAATYDAIVVNGGSPDEATFTEMLDAADAAETSLVFTGTWGVDRGGIRLLEKYTDRVSVGAQGYGEGQVTLTDYATHPLFDGLSDPATLVSEGGYYSVLSAYAGAPLATLSVSPSGDDEGDAVTGLSAGYDWRTAGSVEVVLSTSAVTDVQGPGQGWTDDGAALLVNAVTWAEQATLSAPSVPTVAVPEPGVTFDETVTVSGETTWPAEVTVRRDGEEVAVVEAGFDGAWTADVPLGTGDNALTAVAANAAGESITSSPVAMSRWAPEWQVPKRGQARPVLLSFEGAPLFPEPTDTVTLVVRDSSGDVVQRRDMTWIVFGYFTLLRVPRHAGYTLTAEVVVDGVTLTTEDHQVP